MAIKQRQYIDFKLYVTRPQDGNGACQVALLPTPEVGETITPVTVPAEIGPPADQVAYLAAKSITLRNLVKLGKGLANWLLPEDTIRPLFLEAMKQAGNEGGVRLRLIIADHELKTWPWEFTYLNPLPGPDSMRGFIALDPRISIVRHEPLPIPHPAVAKETNVPDKLRMVVAASSPKEQRELNIEREVTIIREALKDFNVEGHRIMVEAFMDATPPEAAQALKGAGSTFIFHFVGHGVTESVSDPFALGASKEESYLFFIDNKATKTQAKVKADDLAKYLQQGGVRLAFMGACNSGARDKRYPWDGVAGALASRDIPAIVAMQFEVIDTLAIKFSQAFYSSLASGLSLDEAMSFGRLAMYEEAGVELDSVVKTEWGVPVLYSRLPNGIIIPALADHETGTARQIRMAIQQTVDTIEKDGEVVGIQGQLAAGQYSITQKSVTLKGKMVGWQGSI